jgi:hypothetical protein
MSDFGEPSYPVARKQYRCELCYGPIPKGEKHFKYVGVWQGEWQSWRGHDECVEQYGLDDPYNEGFMPGEMEMPERVKTLVGDSQ